MRVINLLALLFISHHEAARILLYNPGFGHSHMRFMGMLGDILLEAGHHITEIRPQLDESLKWESKTKAENIYSFPPDKTVAELFKDTHSANGFLARIWHMDMGPMNIAKQAENMTKIMEKSCENLVERTNLIETLKKETFDIGLSEGFDTCGHGIFGVLGLKTIVTASSSNLLDHQAILLGVPRIPSYVPGGIGSSMEEMSIFERAFNALGSHLGASLFLGIADFQSKIFKKKFGAEIPTTMEMISRSAIMYTNSNPFIDFPAPTIHKVIPIGGIHIKKAKSVDQEWGPILNKKKQTVLISFGSVAKSMEMPIAYKKSVLKMVSNMPEVQFIWKYEGDDLSNEAPENLLLTKWMPQTDLLADPRLSLFITHGGLASTTEIAFSGVPAIVIPLFADQHRNGLTLVRQGIAKVFNKYDIEKPEKLTEIVKNMLNEKGYSEKAKKLSELLKNTPFSSKDLLLKNMEFVARFGSLPQLDPYGRKLSFAQYFLLDVIFVIVTSILLVITLLIFTIKKLTSKIFGNVKSKKE